MSRTYEPAGTKTSEIARTPLGILKATVKEFTEDRGPRMSAALAFRTIFAVAPLLVIAVAVAGAVLGQSSTREQLIQQAKSYTGSQQIADLVETMLQQGANMGQGTLATVLSVVVLLVGASNLFAELKMSLNDIWGVPEPQSGGILNVIVSRLLSVVMVFVTGLVLMATLLLSTVLSRATAFLGNLTGGAVIVTQVAAFVFLYLLTMLLFAIVYRFAPDVRLSWRDVLSGAAVTALLFSIGRLLLSLYLGFGTVGSAYGAAGALAVVLVWLYYSAQIFFFGAEFTQVFARTRGSRWHELKKLDEPAQHPAAGV